MTKEEFRDYVDFLRSQDEISYDVYSGLIDGIDTLEQEPKWILVTEKLPDAGEDVLVTVNLGSVNVVGVDMYSLVEKDGFEGYGKDVIAWMPLPKAYESQENEG